jgi:O-antigen/teichoic acid export membrane protein
MGLVQGIAALGAFLLICLAIGRSADAAIRGYLIGVMLGLAFGLALLRDVFGSSWRRISGDGNLRAGFLAGLRGQIGNVAAFFNYRLDVFIVNYFLNPAQVGLYAIGVVTSEALWQIPAAAATALFPRTARTIREGASEFTCLILRQVFFISCVSGAVLALISPIAVPLVFGARFKPSVAVIWWILPGTIAMSLAKVASSDLAARYKTGYSSSFGVVAFMVTVVLDFLLIPRMGIRGAALASSVAYTVNGVLLLLAIRRELKVGWSELLVPTRAELGQYKKAWLRLAVWSGLRKAPTL